MILPPRLPAVGRDLSWQLRCKTRGRRPSDFGQEVERLPAAAVLQPRFDRLSVNRKFKNRKLETEEEEERDWGGGQYHLLPPGRKLLEIIRLLSFFCTTFCCSFPLSQLLINMIYNKESVTRVLFNIYIYRIRPNNR